MERKKALTVGVAVFADFIGDFVGVVDTAHGCDGKGAVMVV